MTWFFSNKFNWEDRKSTRLNSSHRCISYAVFCLKKKRYYEIAAPDSPVLKLMNVRYVIASAALARGLSLPAPRVDGKPGLLALFFFFFFFKDAAPPEISPLPLPAPFPI